MARSAVTSARHDARRNAISSSSIASLPEDRKVSLATSISASTVAANSIWSAINAVPRSKLSVDIATQARTVLDAYVLQKVNANFNLRLSLQNLLAAETRRQMDAFSAANTWALSSTDQAARSILVSLEGKW